MLFKFVVLVDAGNVRLLEMGSTLYPRQRPLSCCFDCKGFLAVGLGRGKKRQCMGNAKDGKERREGSRPFLFPIVFSVPSQYYSKTSHREPVCRREGSIHIVLLRDK